MYYIVLFCGLLSKTAIILANQRHGKGIEDKSHSPFLQVPRLCSSNGFTRVVSSLFHFLLKMEAGMTSETFWAF